MLMRSLILTTQLNFIKGNELAVRDFGSGKPGPGAIPVSDVASYSINSGLTGSAEILKGSLNFVQNIPVTEKEKRELAEQLVLVSEKIDNMKADFGRRIGRVERSWGDLVPKITLEYYEVLGYKARETDVQVDQKFKIDIIATRDGEVQAIQVKKGEITSGEITETARKASEYLETKCSSGSRKIVTIFASGLPDNFLEIRDELMKQGIELTYLLPNQIIRRLPKYKYIFYE